MRRACLAVLPLIVVLGVTAVFFGASNDDPTSEYPAEVGGSVAPFAARHIHAARATRSSSSSSDGVNATGASERALSGAPSGGSEPTTTTRDGGHVGVPPPAHENGDVCTMTWLRHSNQWQVSRDEHAREGCPLLHQIECNIPPARKPRALVLYMLHTRESAKTMQPEMWNFDYFSRFAVFGANESTDMFSGVDYVFIRMRPQQLPRVSSATLCGERDNIKLLWVPDGPCDLCAHHRAITFLGGYAELREKYGYFVLMNAGVRGPFQHPDASPWIDVLAMSGLGRWTPDTPPIVAGSTINRNLRFGFPAHVQSFLLAFRGSMLPFMEPFLNRCKGTKVECIHQGEVALGVALLRAGVPLHANGHNVTVRTFADGDTLGRILQQRFPGREDPCFTHLRACSGIFLKHGGNFLNAVDESVAAQVAQLTVWQSRKRELGGRETLQQLMASSSDASPFIAM